MERASDKSPFPAGAESPEPGTPPPSQRAKEEAEKERRLLSVKPRPAQVLKAIQMSPPRDLYSYLTTGPYRPEVPQPPDTGAGGYVTPPPTGVTNAPTENWEA